MSDRRNFLKATVAVGAGSALSACQLKEDSIKSASTANKLALFKGILYTRENPGKWAKKVGGHAPIVSIGDDNKVTITNKHGMSKKHFIVRHTIVTQEGDVVAEKTFSHKDDEPISTHEIQVAAGTELYATSFCNKHDMWVTTFTV